MFYLGLHPGLYSLETLEVETVLICEMERKTFKTVDSILNTKQEIIF